jgi:methylenetetrahydrofolate reductase (NADPH)
VSLVNGLPLKPESTIACRTHSLKSFKNAVENRDFAVSAEIFLRPGTSADSIREQAELLRDHVDAILLTDNQFGQLHMSTLVAASILINAGVDPIVQLTSRNRNRIALISDLIGAAALGVTSLLLVRGERAPEEFDPRPKPVLDVNAAELIRVASTVNQDPRMKHFPDFFIGGVVTPHRPRKRWKGKMLTEKIDAGASYLQTNICMDMDILKSFMKQLVDNGIIRPTSSGRRQSWVPRRMPGGCEIIATMCRFQIPSWTAWSKPRIRGRKASTFALRFCRPCLIFPELLALA